MNKYVYQYMCRPFCKREAEGVVWRPKGKEHQGLRVNALVEASVLSLFLCSLEHPEELVVAVLHILSGSHHYHFALWTGKNRPPPKKKEKKEKEEDPTWFVVPVLPSPMPRNPPPPPRHVTEVCEGGGGGGGFSDVFIFIWFKVKHAAGQSSQLNQRQFLTED